MEFVKKSWAQIRAFLGQLKPAEMWLMIAVVALMLLVGFIIVQYAGKAEMVPITAFAAERQGEVVARLKSAGITVESTGGQVLVPVDKSSEALSVLMQGDLMRPDVANAFDQLITRQNPWMTNQQNAQAFLIAKQKVLSLVIAKMAGVRTADVIVSMPDDKGFGRNTTRPSASVNVVMQGDRRVDKALVQAVAGLVSGAMTGMKSQDVVVIDALAGRQHTVKNPADAMPGETLEFVQQLEQYQSQKINNVLSYIRGVIVAVNVMTDPTQTRQVETVDYEKTEPLASEFSREMSRKSASDGGAPGARSNTQIAIETGSTGGMSETTTESRNEFGTKQPIRRVNAVESGHAVQQVNVTVNVPRSYFVALYKQGKADAKDPDDNELAPIVQQQLTQIKAQVQPLVDATSAKGIVQASMIPDSGVLVMGGTGAAGGAATAGLSVAMESAWIRPVGLGLLAALALAMMFGMVKKATQAPKMPSIEELAGVPPPLPTEDELVGEAEEVSPSLTGVELNEHDLEQRRLAEQIADLVRANPEQAAQLVRRWVRTEE